MSHPSRYSPRPGPWSRLLGDIRECAIAEVIVKSLLFTIVTFSVQSVYIRVYVAIGYEDVDPAFVVKVQEGYTPANLVRAETQPGPKIDIAEFVVAFIKEQCRHIAVKCRSYQVKSTCMVVISRIGAHVGLFFAVVARSEERRVGKEC